MLEFDSGGYEAICIFAQKTGGEDGWLSLEDPRGKVQETHMGADWYRQVCFALPEKGTYHIRMEGISIVQMYLSEGVDLLERGVRFLDPENGGKVDLKNWYDTPIREQYHFNPFRNWMNDPNGLCWFKGFYHLFYQANPFGQEWNDMYWGHAVSRDLVHWRHMPYALEPQPNLWRDKERKGGAFSGSAQVVGEEMRLYLTRHDGPQEDGEDTREWQTAAVCRDGIHMEEESPCITEKPEGASFDFRDPKVQRMGDKDYLVLGAAIEGVPSILLYCMEDGKWKYQGPLLQEKGPGIRTFECPDFFELDGKCVAAGAWMCNYDESNRYQMTRCYVGTFDGQEFHVENEQWYDFGSNFYAAQTFEHEGRRIAVGWISDFYGEHRIRENGTYGSASLPRELHIRENRIYMEPIKECYELMGERIVKTGKAERIEALRIPGNCFLVKLELDGERDFSLTVARAGDDALSLVRRNGITGLVSTKKETERVRFPSDVRNVRYVEIFVDRRAVEVYLNHGEAAGTKLFYQDDTAGRLEGEFEAGVLNQLEVWNMKSIWNDKS